MTQSIDLAYKSPMDSATVNQKFSDILQSNLILDGFKVVPGTTGLRLSINIGSSASSAYVLGAGILETANVVDAITLPDYGIQITYYIYLQYTHTVAPATYNYITPVFIPDATQALLAKVAIPAGIHIMSQAYITDMRNLAKTNLSVLLTTGTGVLYFAADVAPK